jgi:hypothetical protein
VGPARDARADALPEQALENARLARAHDDQVRLPLLRELDDRLGGLPNRGIQAEFEQARRSTSGSSSTRAASSRAGGLVGSIAPVPARPIGVITGETLVTIKVDRNAWTSSAARSSARFAGSVSSYPTTIVFIGGLLRTTLRQLSGKSVADSMWTSA